MGSRPGEVIESIGWKDSNEGLLYGDVKVMGKTMLNTVESCWKCVSVIAKDTEAIRNTRKSS
jgi:hypothetical protein